MPIHTPSRVERICVALDAADAGRLTKLIEKVVESEATESGGETEWTLKSGTLQTEIMRSSFLQVIAEAASIGRMTRLQPVEVTSWDESSRSREEEEDEKNKTDDFSSEQHSPRRLRMGRRVSTLLESHVRRNKKEKAHTWAAEATLGRLGVLEERKTGQLGSSTENPYAELPSPVVPRFRKRFCGMTRQKLTECLAQAVAKEAHVRAWRLEHDEKQLRVTEACSCVYCANPSPHQTNEYQKLRVKQVLGPDPAQPNRPLPTDLVPTFWRPILERSTSLHSIYDEAVQKVAAKAWDRQLKLQKKGTAHRVTERCPCVYCKSASVKQTQEYKVLAQSPHCRKKVLSIGVPAAAESPSLTFNAWHSPTQHYRKTTVTTPTGGRPTLSSLPLQHTNTQRNIQTGRQYPPTYERRLSVPSFSFASPTTSSKKLNILVISPTTTSTSTLRKTPTQRPKPKLEKTPSWVTPRLKSVKTKVVEGYTTTIKEYTLPSPPWTTPLSNRQHYKRPSSSNNSTCSTTSTTGSSFSFLQTPDTLQLDDDVDEEEVLRQQLILMDTASSLSLMPPPPPLA
jgi:hypothetical protein